MANSFTTSLDNISSLNNPFGNAANNGGSANPSGIQQLPTVTVTPDADALTVITLTSGGSSGGVNFGGGGNTTGGGDSVIFKASPELEEQGGTAYIIEDSVRAPGSIIIWMGSPARTFTINAKLVSRTVAEARQNWIYKNLLQAWRMPTTQGVGTAAAPEVVTLSGYGDNFRSIPCIVRSVSFSFPVDIDYIDIGNANIPIIWPVNVQLLEYHTNTDMENFDYTKFKTGQLSGWS